MSLSAVTILPITCAVAGRPKASITPNFTAGAICTATFFVGSFMASQTRAASLFIVSAPVGHIAAHWPQEVQLVSASL